MTVTAGSAARSGGSRIRRWWPARAASPAICRRQCWVRFVRSPVARGPHRAHRRARGRHRHHRRRSRGGEADPADAAQVRLCADQPAGAGNRMSCGLSASRSPRSSRRARGGRRHRRSRRGRDRRHAGGRRCARGALAAGAPLVHARGRRQRRGRRPRARRRASTPTMARPHRRIKVAIRSRRQNALPLEARAGACGMGPGERARDAHLRDPDAACDAHRSSPS